VCLDLEGNLLWLRGLTHDFPASGNDVGMSSSPIVAGDTVVVQIESQGDSFVEGMDTQTGQPRWHLPRDRQMAWSSPLVLRGAGSEGSLVLVQSPGKLTAHDPSSGAERWAHKATCDAITSAAAVDGVVYLPAQGITALKPSGAEPEVLWQNGSIQPGAASSIVHDGRLYAINRSGVLLAAEAKTGTVLWRKRLEGSYWSTPALAGSRLYCFSDDGKGKVVDLAEGAKGAIVGEGELGEKIQSSPAVADGALFIRSDMHLWRISASVKR
jgi:outer membrane protein assembly factor BamB